MVLLEHLQSWTGAKFRPYLEFANNQILGKIASEVNKLQRGGEYTLSELWLGSYFQDAFIIPKIPSVSIQWIDDEIGWGIFAESSFQSMEFIAEYTGLVRKRCSQDRTNAYCFEYLLAQGHSTPYVIDACDQGGLSRYVNHSDEPNLLSALAIYEGIAHVVLYTKRAVAKGEQLCYDYGSTYWKHRKKRRVL